MISPIEEEEANVVSTNMKYNVNIQLFAVPFSTQVIRFKWQITVCVCVCLHLHLIPKTVGLSASKRILLSPKKKSEIQLLDVCTAPFF